ncbi:hypothetical protein HDU67_000561 [Dinochytrium kinnereticum]|nr:hypothetical protein HDU67_000561 [Dinochytrium kinnereticum]
MVKLSGISALLVLTAGLIHTGVSAQCSNPITRMEWNQLSNSEKQAFIDAIKRLATRPISGQYTDPNRISYGDFVVTHTNNAFWAHANAQFYVYHRAMLAMWERALATVGWTKGAVYWDWSAVSQNWWESDVFNWFGSQGTGIDRCLTNGEFRAGVYNVSKEPATGPGQIRDYTGNPTCLRRCGSPGQPITDASALTTIFEGATDYTSFRGDDSRNFHAIGHIVVGGIGCDFGNFYFSPNDPLFYLHHAFVDKVWWKWQNLCPNFKSDYEGFLASGEAVSPDQRLDSWPWSSGQMLDTTGGPLCYTYSRSAGDIPHGPNPGCRTVATTTSVVTSSIARGPTSTSDRPSSTTAPATTTSARNTSVLNAAFGDNSAFNISFGSQTLWFQDLTMSLLVLRGRTPLFARDSDGKDTEAISPYNPESAEPEKVDNELAMETSHKKGFQITDALTATAITESVPTLPATKPVDMRVLAQGYVYYHPKAGTTDTAYFATVTGTWETLPSTRTSYTPKSTTTAADVLPTIAYGAPQKAANLPTVYIDPKSNRTIVNCEGKDIYVPKGYRIYRAYRDMVVVLPEGWTHDPSRPPPMHGKRPKILRPQHSNDELKTVVEYVRPKNFIPPPKVGDDSDLDNIRYPPTIPDSYIEGMGMDLFKVRLGERNAKYAIDKCNSDPECKSPSALREARKENRDLSFNKGLEIYGKGILGDDGKSVEKGVGACKDQS